MRYFVIQDFVTGGSVTALVESLSECRTFITPRSIIFEYTIEPLVENMLGWAHASLEDAFPVEPRRSNQCLN